MKMGEYYDFGGLSMNVKSDEERKSKVLKVRLNDKEFAKLKQYTEESGLRSMSEYILWLSLSLTTQPNCPKVPESATHCTIAARRFL